MDRFKTNRTRESSLKTDRTVFRRCAACHERHSCIRIMSPIAARAFPPPARSSLPTEKGGYANLHLHTHARPQILDRRDIWKRRYAKRTGTRISDKGFFTSGFSFFTFDFLFTEGYGEVSGDYS